MSDERFYHGVLVAMDNVLMHGHEVCAAEIIRNVGPEELWKYAKKDQYCYLAELRKVYKTEGIRMTRRKS